MVKFMPLLTWIILSGLLLVSLIIGLTTFASQNNISTVTNDPTISTLNANLTTALGVSSGDTQTESGAFANSSISTTGVTPYISATGGIWKTLIKGPTTIWNILITFVFVNIFGNAAGLIITAVVSTLLGLAIISAVIYLVARGEGG